MTYRYSVLTIHGGMPLLIRKHHILGDISDTDVKDFSKTRTEKPLEKKQYVLKGLSEKEAEHYHNYATVSIVPPVLN